MNRLLSLLGLLLLWTSMVACSSELDSLGNNACPANFSNTLIEQLQQKPKQTPAAEVTQYTYHGQTVYLVTGGCCNNYNYLFDGCGNILCAASGGTANQGDGRCSDFAAAATNPVLVWRDPR
ncbi:MULTISPECIES: DUF6970 domain-containing protein [Hymenobacter]|uniref:DUF6970 domain-containing protein n=1 Tax=Hymenobacter mucosus TaxID=1411120 RepID=A0A238WH66_9BACT|nr:MULTISPECIES: hypothetical protein [Hymenobacter]SNR45905.1 hypothetical protein SAMN06269173_102607 [Hymenobacter mucosus]